MRSSGIGAADSQRVRPLTAEASGCCRVAAEGVFKRDGWQARLRNFLTTHSDDEMLFD